MTPVAAVLLPSLPVWGTRLPRLLFTPHPRRSAPGDPWPPRLARPRPQRVPAPQAPTPLLPRPSCLGKGVPGTVARHTPRDPGWVWGAGRGTRWVGVSSPHLCAGPGGDGRMAHTPAKRFSFWENHLKLGQSQFSPPFHCGSTKIHLKCYFLNPRTPD